MRPPTVSVLNQGILHLEGDGIYFRIFAHLVRKLRKLKNLPWSTQCLPAQLQILFHLTKDIFLKCK